MPQKTCSTCQCNKVCDHNKYGFENCGNYISGDFTPRAEVASEIFAEIEDLMREWFDFFRQDNDIREACAITAALSQISELRKKYTEEGK